MSDFFRLNSRDVLAVAVSSLTLTSAFEMGSQIYSSGSALGVVSMIRKNKGQSLSLFFTSTLTIAVITSYFFEGLGFNRESVLRTLAIWSFSLISTVAFFEEAKIKQIPAYILTTLAVLLVGTATLGGLTLLLSGLEGILKTIRHPQITLNRL